MTKAFDQLDDALASGKNILLYPSGHIYVQGFEHTQGKKMAYELIQNLPKETKILLVRTRGLWGSMYSKAYHGRSPALGSNILLSCWYLIANFFFFAPKRDVSIEISDMTKEVREWPAE